MTDDLLTGTLPFSLTCWECDAGTDIGSRTEAEAQGWTHIIEDADGLAWHYVGVCPECKEPTP